jgi:thioredoxin 1
MSKTHSYIEIASDKDFIEAYEKYASKPIVMDFSAKWCGPCLAIAPVLEKLASSTPEVKFFKIDIDGASGTANSYDVSAVPYFVFVQNGKTVHSFTGASEAKLKEGLKLFQ